MLTAQSQQRLAELQLIDLVSAQLVHRQQQQLTSPPD
jgi:hypothetical protein